jgi:hypothetical protein
MAMTPHQMVSFFSDQAHDAEECYRKALDSADWHLAMINAGASRIGTSASAAILAG